MRDAGRGWIDAFDSLANRRVVLVGGKGGVGKTTIATATALHYAQTRHVVLFTTDPASNLADLAPATRDPRPATLTLEALNAQQLYAQFLGSHLANFLEIGDRGTYLDREELRRFFELSLPGVDELMAWSRIGTLAEENPDALIVVDTAPTGHTMRMLTSGEHFRQFGEALEAMQEKHRGIVRQLTRRESRDAIDAFLEQFENESARRRELLQDPARAAFVPVLLPEPWVVEQTRRLIAEVEIDVPFAVLNRVHECPVHTRTRVELGVRIVEAPRACFPLDSPERIQRWSAGFQPAGPPASLPAPAGSRRTGRQDGGAPRIARLTFLAGKGGVGKTTLATSLALQRGGVLISVDPAHTVRDVFAEQQPPPNLTVETIDTREKWRAFRDSLGEEIERAISALAPRGFSLEYDAEAMQKLVEIAPPGADELFAITRLADLVAEGKQVVVDTAPTGHFLRLIDLPKTAGEWVREFMRILLHYRELIPAGSLGEELIRASRALASLDAAMRGDDCSVIVVTRPERVVVAETKRLIEEVTRRGMHVGGVIANYVTPETDCPCDRSMRAYEEAALADLGDVTIVERRDAPVTKLDDLRRLLYISES